MKDNQKFKICLSMAGAVSAGAYTAGVMDYLLETLDLWEEAKLENRSLGKKHPNYDASIPMHDVEIDVISGASAGGIVGTLSLLNLIDADYHPVNNDNPTGKNNRFYQNWVEMGDDNTADTFEKMLALTDLKILDKGQKPKSLLNSAPIDVMTMNTFQIEKHKERPSYVSNSLDLVLTTTNLRGINFKIDFNGNDKSGTTLTNHAGFFRYKLANNTYKPGIPSGNELYYVLDLKQVNDRDYLKDATLSTAAFPIGLKAREVGVSQEYIKRYPKYLFGKEAGIQPIIQNEEIYKFNSIDGGLINNEPYALALKVLYEKYPKSLINDRHAVIMIDPFPNKDKSGEHENPASDIISVAKGMFKSLRNQAMFNQDGILDAIAMNNRSRFLIEPVRKTRINGELTRAQNDLASAPLSGFAGFISKSFRKHDYLLGRKNCAAFLRYYFAVSQKDMEKKLNDYPSDLAFERFCIKENPQNKDSPLFFPIIPDIKLIKASSNTVDTEKYSMDEDLNYPTYPAISKAYFNKKYKKLIRKRIELVSNSLVSNFWFTVANKIYISNKISNEIKKNILNELEKAALLK